MTDSPGPYAAPVPKTLYVHDDVTDQVADMFGAGSEVAGLVARLFALIRERDPTRVHILTIEEQLQQLIASEPKRAPFDLAIGIGAAGEHVAHRLHDRAGWFPHIHRVDITRYEDGRGGYEVASTSDVPVAQQLAGLEEVRSLAIVDDTVFSGVTMRTVLEALSEDVRARTHAFCLRCVEESLDGVATLCSVSVGFRAAGRMLDEVSFINASGLVTRVGIRRSGGPPMAFFERPEWIHAWFPGYADDVISLARYINEFLEPDGMDVNLT